MRNLVLVACLVLAGMMMASEAYAIGAGPGGRIYLAARQTLGFDKYIDMNSLKIDTAWAPVGTVINHGDILDNNVLATHDGKLTYGCSPELWQYAGDGYGTIVMGACNNNSPLSAYAGYQTLDIMKIKANDTGFDCVTRIGDGRAGKATPNTDVGFYAYPDPKGLYTGGPNNFTVNGWTGSTPSTHHVYAVTDTNGDGDVTDDVEDYLSDVTPSRNYDYGAGDQEIWGNKHYFESYNSYSLGGCQYYTKGSSTRSKYACKGGGTPLVFAKTGENGTFAAQGNALAVGEIDGHTAVWFGISDPGPGTYALAAFIDKNNDGDVHNGTTAWDDGEAFIMYADSDVTGGANDTRWLADIEWVKMANGKMFLLCYSNQSSGTLFALELDADGGYTLGDAGYTLIASGVGPSGVSSLSDVEIEFDSNENVIIPEPATLLLVGTSVLGVLGYIRRRRMR